MNGSRLFSVTSALSPVWSLDTTIPKENPEALFSSKQRAGMVFSSMQRAVTDSLGAMRELRVLPCGGKLVGHY